MKRSHRVSLTASVAITVLLASGAPVAASETRAQEDFPDAAAALEGEFRTVGGAELTVVSDDRGEGERTVVTEAGDGTKAKLVIQSTSVSDKDRAAQLKSLASPVNDPGFSTTKPAQETFKVQAAPLSEGLEWEPVSVVATTDDSASIAWAEDEFSVAGLGPSVLHTTTGQVHADDLRPDTDHRVALRATEDVGSGVVHESRRSMEIATLPVGPDVQARTYQKWTTAYTHETFIPDAKVSAVYCANLPTYEFGGDNRGYRTPSLSAPNDAVDYRTMMFANVNWDNPAPYDVIWSKNVGPSKIYNNGKLVKTLYASSSDMKVEQIQAGSTYAKASFNHTSSNPHCKFLDVNYGGAIRYAEWVEFYRSGTVSADGYRFKAPAHEMYARFNTSTGSDVWRTVSRRANEGFVCLLGNAACGMDFYDVSASY